MARLKAKHVFLNCPFDAGYKPTFNAILFAIHDLGFVPRCALEEDDTSENRLAKVERIIEECPLAINDLSAVAPDADTGLPRFNMPFELGLFLGCKRFGGAAQSAKQCLVLDTDGYRYRQFISDIAGQTFVRIAAILTKRSDMCVTGSRQNALERACRAAPRLSRAIADAALNCLRSATI